MTGAKGGGAGGGAGGGGTKGGGGSRPTGRSAKVRVKTAARRSVSSARWLERQLNDPYVTEAKRRGFRSRAAFKLLQLDEKFRLLRPGIRAVDLGAAPGIDILDMDPVPGATILKGDFLEPDAPAALKAALGGPADLVLSDMAAPATGHPATDHLRIIGLAEAAHLFAIEVLAPGGTFVCKVFQGGAERDLLAALKRDFRTVRHAKPPASRAESAETYVVAQGFRGTTGAEDNPDP
jgi:23S rRNA (uridine2552-2'-O)-methyltransferase